MDRIRNWLGARINVAMPGKTFELMAAVKEATAIVKSVTGLEVPTFPSMGALLGEFVNVVITPT
jgi:hypothetical protein